MSGKAENDDDSFIIVLGTSPEASMVLENSNEVVNEEMNKSQIEDAMKDLSVEANMAFKAQFQLGDSPSPASKMVASTLITDDKSTEELQKRFGELLDENLVLKETLRQNNDSIKEQFMLIASCQEDMIHTHRLHKEKFDETRGLVERLRQENKQLKLDIGRLTDGEVPINSETGESKSEASSGVEFVTSPDDDTIDKLTAQLELIEKQRRQIIMENEKLLWQKDSLERILDGTSKERDDAKEKLNVAELQLSNTEVAHSLELKKLQLTINDLQDKLKSATASAEETAKQYAITIQMLEKKVSAYQNELTKAQIQILDLKNAKGASGEAKQYAASIQVLESKLTTYQNELTTAQIKILDLENIKLEYAQHKSGVAEAAKMYKEQIKELSDKIKEMQIVVFQPVYASVSAECEETSEFAAHFSNVRIYDRALKHLAQYLTSLTNGLSDSLVNTMGVMASLCDFQLDHGSADQLKSRLTEVKQMIERQHNHVLANMCQIRGSLSIFEGIFRGYTEILKKASTKKEPAPPSQSVEQLTAALLARGQELQAAEQRLADLANYKEDCELLQAQAELYKSDFEAERECRELMANEKEAIATDLRTTQRKMQELSAQMEEVRILSPVLYNTVIARCTPPPIAPRPFIGGAPVASPAAANIVYKCPKCMTFTSNQYKVMEDHFDFCLDDF